MHTTLFDILRVIDPKHFSPLFSFPSVARFSAANQFQHLAKSSVSLPPEEDTGTDDQYRVISKPSGSLSSDLNNPG